MWVGEVPFSSDSLCLQSTERMSQYAKAGTSHLNSIRKSHGYLFHGERPIIVKTRVFFIVTGDGWDIVLLEPFMCFDSSYIYPGNRTWIKDSSQDVSSTR